MEYPGADEGVWVWYLKQGRLIPLTLKQRKSIIFVDQPQEFMDRLTLSIKNRFERGVEIHRGDAAKGITHEEPCLLLASCTDVQNKTKRISVTIKIDRINTLEMNLSVACMLVKGLLSKVQIKGLIHNMWVPTHVCGNWKCVTPEHKTVEQRSANACRRSCFAHKACHGQPHKPRCLIGMKRHELQPQNGLFQTVFGGAPPVALNQAFCEKREDTMDLYPEPPPTKRSKMSQLKTQCMPSKRSSAGSSYGNPIIMDDIKEEKTGSTYDNPVVIDEVKQEKEFWGWL